MQTLDFVSGLGNCLEFSEPLSSLYQAMQTRKSFSIAQFVDTIEKRALTLLNLPSWTVMCSSFFNKLLSNVAILLLFSLLFSVTMDFSLTGPCLWLKKSLKGSIVVNVKVAQNLCGASPKISSCQVNAVSRWKRKT